MTFSIVPHARTPWTQDRIITLWCWALDGLTLTQLAEKMGCSLRECDLALWSMVGRNSDEAAIIMNGRRP